MRVIRSLVLKKVDVRRVLVWLGFLRFIVRFWRSNYFMVTGYIGV